MFWDFLLKQQTFFRCFVSAAKPQMLEQEQDQEKIVFVFNFQLKLLRATLEWIKSNLSLYYMYYAKMCNEFARLISASLRPSNTAFLKEMW